MTRHRRDRGDSDSLVRVRIFINHMDFARAWQFEHSKMTGIRLTPEHRVNVLLESKKINWAMLPEVVLDLLDTVEYIGESPKEMRAIDVYASADRQNDNRRSDFEMWLDEELDPLPGFQVHPFVRKVESKQICSHCKEPLARSEFTKGLNTKVACDLLSNAVKDAYDIAVLMMDDAEIVPSVLGVQEIFDKQIIHIGPKGEGEALRSAAWANLPLERLVAELSSADDFRSRYNRRTT